MDIPYRLVRSDRKTVSIQITPDGTVEVRCPRYADAAQVHSMVQGHRAWIEKQLAQFAAKPKAKPLTDRQQKALGEQALACIPGRVRHFAPLVGVTCGRITVRAMRSRWGSCSPQGNLSFNTLLMLAPREVIDYVVVHELCHRKEMNHSPRFWAEVERVLPGYKQQLKWLKDNGAVLMAHLGD